MKRVEKVHILGAPVHVVNMKEALDFVDDRIRNITSPGYVLAMNPEKVIALSSNSFLREIFQGAELLIPDGIGVVLAMKLCGYKVSRVPGADLMQNLCARAPGTGHKIFVYGAREEVNKTAVDTLRKRHPGIQIVGRANGYRKAEEMDDLVTQINDSGADILFVALGSPRQEKWIYENLHRLNVKICQGIGGTLDTIAGNVKRAPKCFQAAGLEWFYRLLCEPSRLGRQIRLFVFVWDVLWAKMKGNLEEP